VKRILAATLLAVAAILFLAQAPPSPSSFTGTPGANKHNKLFQEVPLRFVTVGPDHLASFPTVKSACDFVATQNPTSPAAWKIKVYSGAASGIGSTGANYREEPFTVPPETSIEGDNYGQGNSPSTLATVPIVYLTHTSGAGITLQGGDTLFNLRIRWNATPTAAGRAVEVNGSGQGVAIANTVVDVIGGSNAFQMDGIVNTVGSLYLHNSGVTMSGNALGRALVNNAASGITVYGPTRFHGSSGCATLVENAHASGVLNLFSGVRLDSGCTVDIRQSSTGAVTVYPGVAYGPVSGTITNAVAHASSLMLGNGASVFSGAGAPEGAVTAPVGSLWLRTDCTLTTTCLCVKESGAGNTGWICK